MTGLADSGCGGVILHNRHAALVSDLQLSTTRLQFADGTLSEPCTQGLADITVTDTKGQTCTTTEHVYLADIKHDIILGMQWLKEANCIRVPTPRLLQTIRSHYHPIRGGHP